MHPKTNLCAMAVLMLIIHPTIAKLPASDPQNVGNWTLFEPLSDEFNEAALNTSKWLNPMGGWVGRNPGLFDAANTFLANGTLQLWAHGAHRNASWPAGFDNFTTASMRSHNLTARGYFEVRSKSGNSAISSSFWFHNNDGNGTWTEIDVFESVGSNCPGCKYNMSSKLLCSHTHIFMLAGVAQKDLPAKCGCTLGSSMRARGHEMPPPAQDFNSTVRDQQICSAGDCTPLPFALDGDFHTFGLQWNTTTVQFFVDGRAVSALSATCLGQPLGLDFDRETMPDWMGLPPQPFGADVPFVVDYVRAWKSA